MQTCVEGNFCDAIVANFLRFCLCVVVLFSLLLMPMLRMSVSGVWLVELCVSRILWRCVNLAPG